MKDEEKITSPAPLLTILSNATISFDYLRGRSLL